MSQSRQNPNSFLHLAADGADMLPRGLVCLVLIIAKEEEEAILVSPLLICRPPPAHQGRHELVTENLNPLAARTYLSQSPNPLQTTG